MDTSSSFCLKDSWYIPSLSHGYRVYMYTERAKEEPRTSKAEELLWAATAVLRSLRLAFESRVESLLLISIGSMNWMPVHGCCCCSGCCLGLGPWALAFALAISFFLAIYLHTFLCACNWLESRAAARLIVWPRRGRGCGRRCWLLISPFHRFRVAPFGILCGLRLKQKSLPIVDYTFIR